MRQLESEEMHGRHSVELQWHQQLVEDVVRSQQRAMHTMEREGQRRHQDALSKACVLFVCLFVCLCACTFLRLLSETSLVGSDLQASKRGLQASSKQNTLCSRYKPVPRADTMMCTYAMSGGVYAMLEMAPLLRFTG